MAKRELSSTLRNLKFMQRAAQREEKTKKEEDVKPDENLFSPGAVNKRCVVVMEGDPHPGATMGRMSFRSFNPSIDKLYEEAGNAHKPEAYATSSGNHSGKVSFRENGPLDGAEYPNFDKLNYEANGDLKRKQPEEVLEKYLPNKSPKTVEGGQHSSPHNNKASFKQLRRTKLDWNVPRPSNGKNRRGDVRVQPVHHKPQAQDGEEERLAGRIIEKKATKLTAFMVELESYTCKMRFRRENFSGPPKREQENEKERRERRMGCRRKQQSL